MARQPGWPADLRHEDVRVRPLRRRDVGRWCELRHRNASWLAPWESTLPGGPLELLTDPSRATFGAMRRTLARYAARGLALPFVIDAGEGLVGQVTVSAVTRGSLSGATVGYWIDESHAGRGITTTAVALVVDHCFYEVGLHRIELNVRPQNAPSRRLAEKLGFRDEGLRLRYLHIDGGWRDHLCYALTREEVPGGVLRRLIGQGGGAQTSPKHPTGRGAIADESGDTPTRLPADEQGGR
jgi:ribosomal-protein-alanine N-acetyltransferase